MAADFFTKVIDSLSLNVRLILLVDAPHGESLFSGQVTYVGQGIPFLEQAVEVDPV